MLIGIVQASMCNRHVANMIAEYEAARQPEVQPNEVEGSESMDTKDESGERRGLRDILISRIPR